MGTFSEKFSPPNGDIIAQIDAFFGSTKWRTARIDQIGEFVFMSSLGRSQASDLLGGLLWVTPGTVVNGALDYPIWAAANPGFVSGNNIVFPSNVNGMFLRNVGGNAATQGGLQGDATARNGLTASRLTTITRSGTDVNSNSATVPADGTSGWIETGANDRYRFTNDRRSDSLASSDVETRPFNRAYQLMTKIDSYGEFA